MPANDYETTAVYTIHQNKVSGTVYPVYDTGISLDNKAGFSVSYNGKTVTTTADGKFSFGPFVYGTKSDLTISKTGYTTVTLENVAVDPDSEKVIPQSDSTISAIYYTITYNKGAEDARGEMLAQTVWYDVETQLSTLGFTYTNFEFTK